MFLEKLVIFFLSVVITKNSNISSKNNIFIEQTSFSPTDKEYIETNINENPFPSTDFSITLSVNSTNNLLSYSETANNLFLENILNLQNRKSIHCDFFLSGNEGSTTLLFKTSTSEISLQLFAINSDYGTFVSTNSLEECRDRLTTYKYNNCIISDDEYAFQINSLSNSFFQQKTLDASNVQSIGPKLNSKSSQEHVINGKIKLIDEENDFETYLLGSLVELRAVLSGSLGSIKLGENYIDSNGFYSISFSLNNLIPGFGFVLDDIEIINVQIRVSSKSLAGVVYKNLLGDYYFLDSETFSLNLNDCDTEQFETSFYVNSLASKSFLVTEAMYYGYTYVKAVDKEHKEPPQVNCYYPNSTNYQSPIGIHIQESSYRYFDVILHEYGHVLQDWLNIALNPSFSHTITSDSSIEHGDYLGTLSAWAESWNTVFAILVGHYFNINSLPLFGDNIYNQSDLLFDLENGSPEILSYGEACEGDIMCVLFDLYDSYSNNEAFDLIELGHQGLWELIENSYSLTFGDFYRYVSNEKLLDMDNFSKILEHYGFCCTDVSTYNVEYPFIAWTPGGNPNDRESNIRQEEFAIRFYDKNKNMLFTETTDRRFYNFNTYNVWDLFVQRGKQSYFKIISFSPCSSFETQFIPMVKPSYFNNGYYLYTDDYHFNNSYTNEAKTINAYDMEINISSLRCGYIQNDCINLSPRKNNCGEAYIKYDFDKNIRKVCLNISLWSEKENLHSNDSSITVEGIDGAGNVEIFDININNLSQDRNNQNQLTFDFANPIVSFKITALSSPVGSSNKGRVSIGNILFIK